MPVNESDVYICVCLHFMSHICAQSIFLDTCLVSSFFLLHLDNMSFVLMLRVWCLWRSFLSTGSQRWPAGGMWAFSKHMGLIRGTLLLDSVQLNHNRDLQDWWSPAIWQGQISRAAGLRDESIRCWPANGPREEKHWEQTGWSSFESGRRWDVRNDAEKETQTSRHMHMSNAYRVSLVKVGSQAWFRLCETSDFLHIL